MSENDMEALDAFLDTQLLKSFVFKLRTKVERYQNCEPISNTTVLNVEKVNFMEYNEYLIENIKRLTGVDK